MSCHVARKQKLFVFQDSRIENGDVAYVGEELYIGGKKFSLALCIFRIAFHFTVVNVPA
jgi:hypothetical protein